MDLPKEIQNNPISMDLSKDLSEMAVFGATPQNLLETAAIFNAQIGGTKESPSRALMSSHIDKVSNDLSFELSRLSNDTALNGQSVEFSIFMPRLGKLDVHASNINNNLMLLMKTDSRPFREKLKSNKEKMERSVTRSLGKKTRIRVLDDE
ncbi:MAG: hypothetical protein KTR16_05825 [Acidiferrobacterales bacterium]|nr:hypothetical protein [Acidiferrobacterales bacterium]